MPDAFGPGVLGGVVGCLHLAPGASSRLLEDPGFLYLKAPRTHILRLLGLKTISYMAFEPF